MLCDDLTTPRAATKKGHIPTTTRVLRTNMNNVRAAFGHVRTMMNRRDYYINCTKEFRRRRRLCVYRRGKSRRRRRNFSRDKNVRASQGRALRYKGCRHTRLHTERSRIIPSRISSDIVQLTIVRLGGGTQGHRSTSIFPGLGILGPRKFVYTF